MKKTLSVLLAFIIAFSCMTMVASAATAETVTQYGQQNGYLAIGDSISRGCGATGFYKDRDGNIYGGEGGQYDLYDMRNVEGALPYLIAEAVGCKAPMDMTDQDATYWPFCYPGMTLGVTMDLLGIEDNFKDEKLDYPYYDSMLKYFGYEGSFDGVREKDVYVEGESGQCGNIMELIGKADLITLQLGMCDVFYRAYRIATKGGFLKDGWGEAIKNVDSLLGVVKTAIGEMKNGFDYFEKYYPVLLAKIRELNPDATIVVVGAFNVINELTITDDMITPVGSVASVLTDKMNKDYKKWAKQYGALYADVSNTEILAAEEDWSLLGDFISNTFTGTHPSQNGYNYMARQVLSVLPEAEQSKKIVVDLGRFTKVDKVLINGIPVDKYEMNGYKLTIDCSNPLATNLTIKINNEDGTVSMQTYKLHYSIKTGFTAERVYGTNDYNGTLKKPFELIKKLLKMIVDKIKGIFKK